MKWLGDLSTLDKFLVICAVMGAIMVVIRLALQFLFGAGDSDVGDVDVGDVDIGDVDGGDVGDVDVGDGDIGQSDISFTLLSFQSMSAFLLMFGLVGFALHNSAKLHAMVAVCGGAVAGLIMVWILTKLMSAMMRLQSSGTLILKNAIDEEGEVYLRIPEGGIGKVQVVLQGRLKVMNAKSKYQEEIPTGQRVKVVDIVSGNVLVVEKL